MLLGHVFLLLNIYRYTRMKPGNSLNLVMGGNCPIPTTQRICTANAHHKSHGNFQNYQHVPGIVRFFLRMTAVCSRCNLKIISKARVAFICQDYLL